MVIHTVQPGETVWSLANRYGVSPSRIISDNSIANPRSLVVGQALVILIPKLIYTVQPGDTLQSISVKYGVQEITLLQYNPELIFSPYLRAGQGIVIRLQEEKRRTITVNGYAYSYIDLQVLRRCLPYLTTLTIFGYGFTETGELIPIEDGPLIELARRYQTAPVMLLSSVTEDGNFSSQRASLLFRDAALQDKIFENILRVMGEKGYIGLDIDFEYVNAEDAGNFQNFLRRAGERLHSAGYFLHVDLAPKTSSGQAGLLYESHDYAAIGALADTVLLMTYEWGYTYGPPMAVAPLNKVRQVAEYGVSVIPPKKILLGLANYGYDWILPYEKQVTRATAIGNEYAVEIAGRYGVPIQFEEPSHSPTFDYWGRIGRKHVVWFEDARSIEGKFQLIEELSLLGGGYWNVMRPFNQNWALLSARYDIKKLL